MHPLKTLKAFYASMYALLEDMAHDRRARMTPAHFIVFFLIGLLCFWIGGAFWAFLPFTTGILLVDSLIASGFLFGIFYLVWNIRGSEVADEVA